MRSVMWKVMYAVLLTACGEEAGLEPADFEGEDAAVTVPSEGDAGSDSATNNASDAGVGSDAATPVEDAAVVQDSATPESDASTSTSDAGTDAGPSNPCTTVYYRDVDGDGFGDAAKGLTSCSKPSGYVANKQDCYDASDKVHPGQEGRFSQHRGDGSFDYDCDGVSLPLWPKIATLPVFNGSECPLPRAQLPGQECDYTAQADVWRDLMDGWFQAVAACGVEAPYGPGYRLTWSDDTRTYGYQDIGLQATRIQPCN